MSTPVTMFAALLVLVVAGAASADFADSFDRQLRVFMNESVAYSTPRLVAPYEMGTPFRPRGMGHLYNATDYFLKLIQRKDPLPEGVVVVEHGLNYKRIRVHYAGPYWRMAFQHNVGIVAVVCGAAVFAAALLVCGVVFCCCRCSGRCGARWQPFDKKHDRCRRVTLGMMLSAVTILILFGMVCSFVTNEFVQEATNDLPRQARIGINNSVLFLENTKQEVHNLLLTNYKQLENTLNQALNTSGSIVTEQLSEMSNATDLASLVTLENGLVNIRNDLQEISKLTASLHDNYLVLDKELSETRAGLMDNLRKCSAAVACTNMLAKYNISAVLNTDADFNKLPDIGAQLEDMKRFDDVPAGVTRGRAEFRRVRDEIQEAVDSNTADIKRSLEAAGQGVARIDQDMTKLLEEARLMITTEKIYRLIDKAEMLIVHYAPYRYYLNMSMNCMLLLIFFCLTMGLFYGFCGRRPDGHYSNDCCNKATGAKFLMIAVWLAFVFGGVMALATAAMFAVGVVSERGVCEPLRHPEDSQVMRLVDEMNDVGELFHYPRGRAPDINVSQLIMSCHANHSLYTVLALENVFNVSQVSGYLETYRLSEHLEEFRRDVHQNKVVLLDRGTREKLEKLADAQLDSVDFPQFTSVLSKQVVAIDLIAFARALNKTAVDIQMNPNFEGRTYSKYFMEQAIRLQRLHRTVVVQMQNEARLLDKAANDLQEHLLFGNTSLQAAVETLIEDLQHAQTFLDKSMDAGVKEVNAFTNRFVEHVDHYLDRVVSETQENVARCGPISSVYNASLTATCDNLLRPFNGFWASFGWSLLLFIPMIVLCVKLASLYQKSDKYPGPQLNDTEHLYDAYADHDNIPLANVHDKKNHHRSYHETYDNSMGGDYSRGAAPPLHQSQARYTDAAPKHWDYPAAIPPGGSPRYHSPPLATEYERPPPYYYPGPGEPNQR